METFVLAMNRVPFCSGILCVFLGHLQGQKLFSKSKHKAP